MNGFIRRSWGKFGIKKVDVLASGFFLVKFNNDDGKRNALNNGPIMFDRKPVIIKEWDPNLDLQKESVKRMPVWIRMPGLNLKYWGASTLSKLAGLVGNPIRTDRLLLRRKF